MAEERAAPTKGCNFEFIQGTGYPDWPEPRLGGWQGRACNAQISRVMIVSGASSIQCPRVPGRDFSSKETHRQSRLAREIYEAAVSFGERARER